MKKLLLGLLSLLYISHIQPFSFEGLKEKTAKYGKSIVHSCVPTKDSLNEFVIEKFGNFAVKNPTICKAVDASCNLVTEHPYISTGIGVGITATALYLYFYKNKASNEQNEETKEA